MVPTEDKLPGVGESIIDSWKKVDKLQEYIDSIQEQMDWIKLSNHMLLK